MRNAKSPVALTRGSRIGAGCAVARPLRFCLALIRSYEAAAQEQRVMTARLHRSQRNKKTQVNRMNKQTEITLCTCIDGRHRCMVATSRAATFSDTDQCRHGNAARHSPLMAVCGPCAQLPASLALVSARCHSACPDCRQSTRAARPALWLPQQERPRQRHWRQRPSTGALVSCNRIEPFNCSNLRLPWFGFGLNFR